VVGTCGYGEELSGSIIAGNFLTSCKVYWLASQEGLCSVEYVSKYNSLQENTRVNMSDINHIYYILILQPKEAV
jgi:predicted DNA-binding ArsR family transcriptional regulator